MTKSRFYWQFISKKIACSETRNLGFIKQVDKIDEQSTLETPGFSIML